MNCRRILFAAFGCWSVVADPTAKTSIAGDHASITHGAIASRKQSIVDVQITSVKPSGIGDHRHDWVAAARVDDSKDKTQILYLFMHSPVLKFGVSAEELSGQRFRIVVLQWEGDKVLNFEVDHDGDAK